MPGAMTSPRKSSDPDAVLTGQVILVTGASRGLGREMALELAASGATLALHGSRASAELSATAEQALAVGASRVERFHGDVSDADACKALVSEVETRLGPIDTLVNNAGVSLRLVSETFNTVPTKFWQAPPEAWTRIIATNLNGPMFMASAVAPGMIARKGGKIINISTSSVTMVRKGYSPYGPSKAALEAASRIWAQDLEGTGVTVNVYLPGGAADTDLLPPSPNKKGADGNLLPASIMRRGIVWLCGPESDSVTGARFIARHWDVALPAAEAAAAARSRPCDLPEIM